MEMVRPRMKVTVELACNLAIHNRRVLETVENCGCYSCCRLFAVSEIKEWVDKAEAQEDSETALCPHCSIDAVLPSFDDEPLNATFLSECKDYWLNPEEGLKKFPLTLVCPDTRQ